MKKTALFLLAFIIFFSIPVYAATVENIEAPTYYLASLDNGSVLVEENCSANISQGDFAKIMTALIATEKLNMTDSITFESDDLVFNNTYGNIANVKAGESLTVKEHLYNMLLLYSDASANALARKISGDTEKFCNEMNEKAKVLNMGSTNFTSPSGYDKSGKSKISVADLAKMAHSAYSTPSLKEIFSTVLFDLNGKTHSSRNHLLSHYTYSSYTYSYASGMMVCPRYDTFDIISTASKDSMNLLAIVIGSPDSSAGRHYKDTINLFEHGFNNFYLKTICPENTIVDKLQVKMGNKKYVNLETSGNCVAYVPTNFDESLLTCEITKNEPAKAPIKEGTVIAGADFYYNGNKIATIPLKTTEKVRFSLLGAVFALINTKVLFVLIVLGVLVLFSRYRTLKKKEARRKRREKLLKR